MPRLSARSKPARHKFKLEAAGVSTHVLRWGEGGTTPLVLLHGVLSDGASWSGVAPRLAEGRQVLAPDMPLHGRTRTPPSFDMGPAGMSEWMAALLDSLGADRADVCGLSMGGAVAAHFAVLKTSRVRRLVLVDAANIASIAEPYDGLLEEVRQAVRAKLGSGVPATSQDWTSEVGLRGPAAGASRRDTDRLIAGALRYMKWKGVPLGQLLAGLELLRPLEARELASITAPTLAIWGEDDPYFPATVAAAALRANLPEARVEVLSGVGHNPVGERPDEFVRLMSAFLACGRARGAGWRN